MGLLDQFFGGYFLQDWSDDDSSWQTAVARYRAEVAEPGAGRVAEEIIQLIRQYLGDASLAAKLNELGGYYWPGAQGLYHGRPSEVARALR